MKRCGGSEAWSAENCAAATVFCESECVVWLASKERARSREAFLRSVRGVLKRLAIDVTRLRGRWLVLAEDSVVRAEAARRATAVGHLGDGDSERVIVLSGGPRHSYARALQVRRMIVAAGLRHHRDRKLAFSLAHRKLSVAQNRNGRATS